jgi:hypothetical protein
MGFSRKNAASCPARHEICHRSDGVLASDKLSIGGELVRRTLCLLCLVLAVGCRRQKGPDANYDKAAKLYQQLYAAELDDAYGDPQMNQVVALLKKVDDRSVDADAAQTMLRAIDHGREELAKSRAAREKMGAAAAASAAHAIANIDPTQILAASQPDAGPDSDPYAAGSLISEINTSSGGCLVDGEPFQEQGTGATGIVYRRARSQPCAEKLPGLEGQVLLVVGGRIYRRVPDTAPPPAGQAVPIMADAGP